ncbi:MAG: hypothetical protein GEV12_10250 [Micromonosporaceae bacterium]|nr:hypothetical protein [Micromonosporaceae bacterium]
MSEPVDLSPVRFAELVAPAVSRTFVAGMRAGGTEGRDLVTSYGGASVGYLIDLRNPLAAGRRLTPADLAAVYRYRNPDEVRATVRGGVADGLLAEGPDGAVAAGDRGQEFLRDLFALHGRVLTERWRPQSWPVDRLNQVLTRVLAAAEETAGAAWAVQAPPYEPADAPPGVLLLNRLSTLRYHRADAHAAAWQAAGLTAAEMVAMPWGTDWSPQRRAVEQATNQRAAAPFAVLTAEERLTLLADLAALP